ncbi:MAG: hypothetical protein NT033_05075, partial [Candidatus Omnitrophica bacterium]|nr:hypothetical protein [Candidatus Omnitrophota bacterium]
MRKKVFIYFVFFVLTSILSTTCIWAETKAKETTVQHTQEFEFVRDYIQGLSSWKSSIERHMDANYDRMQNNDNGIHKSVVLMKNLRLANGDLNITKQLLERYKNSSNEIVRQAVQYALVNYDALVKINDKGIELQEKLNSSELIKDPTKFDQGAAVSEMSKISANKDYVSESLLQISTMVALSLVDKNPDKDGKLTYLIVTSDERNQLVKL